MDRTVKFLLSLIAFSLISLNLQLAGFGAGRRSEGGYERG
jgi:hypothetical protein